MDIFDKLGIEVFEGIYLLVIVVQVIFEWERYFKHGEIPFEFGCNKQFREVFFLLDTFHVDFRSAVSHLSGADTYVIPEFSFLFLFGFELTFCFWQII